MGTVLSAEVRFKEREKREGNTYNGRNSINKGSGLFLNLSMTDIFTRFSVVGCPSHVFSSIPGLYSLDASNKLSLSNLRA